MDKTADEKTKQFTTKLLPELGSGSKPAIYQQHSYAVLRGNSATQETLIECANIASVGGAKKVIGPQGRQAMAEKIGKSMVAVLGKS